MKHTYKDFVTGKIRFTKGIFIGWTAGAGIIQVKYAIFKTRASEILVPEYLLTKETKAQIKEAQP